MKQGLFTLGLSVALSIMAGCRSQQDGWKLVWEENFDQELVRAKVLPEDYDFEAHKELVPMQPGDVPVTYADTSALERDFGYKPSTSLRTGLRNFAEWYAEFYK